MALLGLLALAYAPLFGGRLLFHRDVSRFLHPIRWFVDDCIRRGQWPWWNPHVGLGHAMLADPQSAIFYPVNLLHLLAPLPFAMMAVMFLHLVWGALGMARVARGFGLGDVAGLVAGLAWALSGYVASLWTNGARLPSCAWVPWQAVAAIGLVRAATGAAHRPALLRSMALGALATGAAILAGDVFVAIMGALLGPALGVASALARGPRPELQRGDESRARAGMRAGIALLGASAVGVLLAMVALLPAAAGVRATERASGFALNAAAAGSLHPLRLVELLAPEAFARAWYLAPDQAWVQRFLDGAPMSLSIYGGATVLALVVLAAWPRRTRDTAARASSRAILVVMVAGGFFLLLALGRHTPAFAAWRALVIPLRYLRTPEKYLIAVVPCLALLAGWGAQRLLDRDSGKDLPWKAVALVPLLAALAMVSAGILFPPELSRCVRERALHALLGALAIPAVFYLGRRRGAAAKVVLVLAVAADLALGATFALRFDEPAIVQRPAVAEAVQPSLQPTLPFPRLFRGAKVQQLASLAEDDGNRATMQTLRENIGVPFGIAMLPGYGVVIPPALGELLGRGRLDALRLLSVDFALLSAPAGRGGGREGLREVLAPFPNVRLFEVERRLPRAYLAFRTTRLPPRERAEHLLDADVVGGTNVLVEDDRDVALPRGESAAAAPPVPCTLDRFDINAIVATCTAPAPAVAVFVEQYADGWRATLDGAAVPLVRANGMLRAVAVPAGRHTIHLTYAPPGLHAGLALSLLGASLVLGLFLAAALLRPRT